METGKEIGIGPEPWIEAALAALADDGEAGIAIEPIARRLGVTKGSFYWHFADREALWTAVLGTFFRLGVEEPIERVGREPDPRVRLEQLLAIVWEARHLRIERTLLGSRREDVKTCLATVHARRREFLTLCYLDLAFSLPEAENHATTSYALYLGVVQLSGTHPFDDQAALDAWVLHANRLLIPAFTRSNP